MTTARTRGDIRRGRPAEKRPSWWSSLIGGLQESGHAVGSLVIVDLLVGVLMVARMSVPGVPVPIADASILALVALSTFRRPTRNAPSVVLFTIAAIGVLAFVAVITYQHDGEVARRGLRVFGFILFAAFLADGRIHARSILTGVAIGLTVNVPLFYAGLLPDAYHPWLTGALGDKNYAGLFYAVAFILIGNLARSTGLRWGIVAIGAVLVSLTGSRTATAGYTAAVVWLLIGGRLPFLGRVGLGFGLGWALNLLEERAFDLGLFRDRAGSDALRARIDEATSEKIATTPWTGTGFGSAEVELDDRQWFFHNSYLALFAEGGWVLVVAMCLAFLVVVFAVRGGANLRSKEQIAAEAAGLAILICATRLGEVFITPVTFLVLGLALRELAVQESAATDLITRRREERRAARRVHRPRTLTRAPQ